MTAAAALFSLACTSTYQVRFGTTREQWPHVREHISHCLASLAFHDASSEDLYPKFMEEDPSIVEVWAPDDRGSFFSTPPVAIAWVIQEQDQLYVHFQPPNSQGVYAKFLANTFSKCMQIHDPSALIEITSGKIVPDLR